MDRVKSLKVTMSVIEIWIMFYIADVLFGFMPIMSGKGFSVLNVEYYRLFTGFLLHGNVIHLILNVLAMFFIGYFLEEELGSAKFLIFTITALIISQTAYYLILPKIDNVFGGSILTYTYIGLILVLITTKKDFPRLKIKTLCGSFIMIYAIAGNIPFFPFMNYTTLILHAVSLISGFIIGSFFTIQ